MGRDFCTRRKQGKKLQCVIRFFLRKKQQNKVGRSAFGVKVVISHGVDISIGPKFIGFNLVVSFDLGSYKGASVQFS